MENYKYKHLGYYRNFDDVKYLSKLAKCPESVINYFLTGHGQFRAVEESYSDLQTLQRVPSAVPAYEGSYYIDFTDIDIDGIDNAGSLEIANDWYVDIYVRV